MSGIARASATWVAFATGNGSATVPHVLPRHQHTSVPSEHLSVVTKLKGSVPVVVFLPFELTDVFLEKDFKNKFHMSALNTASYYSYHLSLISRKILV